MTKHNANANDNIYDCVAPHDAYTCNHLGSSLSLSCQLHGHPRACGLFTLILPFYFLLFLAPLFLFLNYLKSVVNLHNSCNESMDSTQREDTEVREAAEEVKDQPGIKASVKHGAIDTRGAGKIMKMSKSWQQDGTLIATPSSVQSGTCKDRTHKLSPKAPRDPGQGWFATKCSGMKPRPVARSTGCCRQA